MKKFQIKNNMGNLNNRMPTRGNPLRIPTVVEVIDTDPLLGYRISDRDNVGAGGFNYYGYMKKDGNFYIMREEIATGAYRYYKGVSGNYAAIWTLRADPGTTYDYLNVIFA